LDKNAGFLEKRGDGPPRENGEIFRAIGPEGKEGKVRKKFK
jgi:hypothetical protein